MQGCFANVVDLTGTPVTWAIELKGGSLFAAVYDRRQKRKTKTLFAIAALRRFS